MTENEALKMAIEFMETLTIDVGIKTWNEKHRKEAIKACEEALEQPKNTQPLDEVIEEFMKDPAMKQAMDKARETVKDYLTIQEPTAWMNDIAFSMDKELLGNRGRIVALYSHPPKEWQGLSDDEIWNIANFLGKNKQWDYPVMFAKTIEKALREKNHE